MAVDLQRQEDKRQAWLGVILVAGAAIAWSYGGVIQRFITEPDIWTVVFWRCLFAGLFLFAFMLLRDGMEGTVGLFRAMGWPGFFVAVGFATVSTCFVLAVSKTTVASVVLFMAAIPLFAALFARIFIGELIGLLTWAAIAAVGIGVTIMVSASLGEGGSLGGLILAAAIPVVFGGMIVLTRRYPHIRMTPAASAGSFLAAIVAASQVGSFAVAAQDMLLLFAYGGLNLGLGMALYVTGARFIPSALAGLLGTLEMILAPLWVAILFQEIPSRQTILGGSIVFAALLVYLLHHFLEERRLRRASPL
ncbi:DMT family transporter [Peteryoungia desertarenae]|uniref:DMT family transporter n=1 Tax=Peteryoungia desertarenae TaxID=1813451 RepID=A0ABX6QLN7_9HYPH|nr:DMT family transporter [Peteryoungia desertarenae]QLF69241.1 DMT family transporter [Peteryoungia desertarenae]